MLSKSGQETGRTIGTDLREGVALSHGKGDQILRGKLHSTYCKAQKTSVVRGQAYPRSLIKGKTFGAFEGRRERGSMIGDAETRRQASRGEGVIVCRRKRAAGSGEKKGRRILAKRMEEKKETLTWGNWNLKPSRTLLFKVP